MIAQLLNHVLDGNAPKELFLTGYAGTGKTHTIVHFIKALQNYATVIDDEIAIPVLGLTHVACDVLRVALHKAGASVRVIETLHKHISHNPKNTTVWIPPLDPKWITESIPVVIIDEATRMNNELRQRLLHLYQNIDCKILYVGDDAQLGNIDGESVDWKSITTYRLTQVYRASNPVLTDLYIDCAKAVINNGYITIDTHPPYIEQITEKSVAIKQLKDAYTNSTDNVVIAYTHSKLHSIWQLLKEFVWVSTDQMHVYDADLKKVIISHLERHIVRNPIRYPYHYPLNFMTAHKSQGLTYKNVNIILDDFAGYDYKRLLYVAVSRAQEKVTLLGDIHPRIGVIK